ncbi:MAG TPA: glycoside hydrolase family 2 TIM barrel-domain containing protein [Candidatus Ratteibacteria bacterium]|nr:glycoside hydrolase family 2 TIM barrel-domain containing protein [Candidatus Ratteibacteria bacterium]
MERTEFPRPDFKRDEYKILNGIWDFEIDKSNTGIERELFLKDKKFSEKIVIPFPPESKLSKINEKDFMVSVWYKKEIEIPENWKNKRIFLNFGAVDFKASVWINEHFLGTHIGGYTPFSFEITNYLKRGKNYIVLNAYDDNRLNLQPAGKQSLKYNSYGCSYTRTTGIWQTVYLVATGKNYIEKIKISPDIENEKVNFFIDTTGGKFLEFEIYFSNEKVGFGKFKVDKNGIYSVPINKIIFWDCKNPALYDVKIKLFEDNKTLVDEIYTYFGIRTIKIAGNRIYLNGEKLFMKMVLDQGYYPDGIYTAKNQEELKKDIIISKNLGFNGARLHQKIFDPIYLYWADKLGYLVWEEYPNWGIRNRISEETFHILLYEWISSIERDINHPSIIGWCPLNETTIFQNPDLVKILYRITKKFDITRPVIDTSGYVHVETDIYDCHNYKQNPEEFKNDFEKFKTQDTIWKNFPEYDAEYQGQPYWISEYGGIWWSEEESGWGYGDRPKNKKEFLERYNGLTKVLLNHPKISGFCYTQLYDVEQEKNGLYTYERELKFNPEIIRRINSGL